MRWIEDFKVKCEDVRGKYSVYPLESRADFFSLSKLKQKD